MQAPVVVLQQAPAQVVVVQVPPKTQVPAPQPDCVVMEQTPVVGLQQVPVIWSMVRVKGPPALPEVVPKRATRTQ